MEIRKIPENISQSNIEKYVIKVFESIGVKVQSYDLVAVHQIGKFTQGKHRNVIVRFINRKNAFSCLKHSSKLAKSGITEYRKLFITENLCPANKQIFNYLYKLKKQETLMCGHLTEKSFSENPNRRMILLKRLRTSTTWIFVSKIILTLIKVIHSFVFLCSLFPIMIQPLKKM